MGHPKVEMRNGNWEMRKRDGVGVSVLQTTVHAKHSTYLCNNMPLPHFVIFAHAQFYDNEV